MLANGACGWRCIEWTLRYHREDETARLADARRPVRAALHARPRFAAKARRPQGKGHQTFMEHIETLPRHHARLLDLCAGTVRWREACLRDGLCRWRRLRQ